MIDLLDMLDLVEAQVQARKFDKLLQAFDMRDQVVVKVEFGEGRCKAREPFNRLYAILT